MAHTWTLESIIHTLQQTEQKGFISADGNVEYRVDDGVVGQVLEREFGVTENNLHIADLNGEDGENYELKTARKRKGTNRLTLFHQKPTSGMTVREIFEEFGYIKKSSRSDVMKKKLFTTIKGDRENNRGFRLVPETDNIIHLYNKDRYLCTWNMDFKKLRNVILTFAETQGSINSKEEAFHYVESYLLSDLRSMKDAILNGYVVLDFSVDKSLEDGKMHDRGPHLRINVKKLNKLFNKVEQIL